MGIVRHDPVKNLDTEQILDMRPQRVTRSTLHRILKRYGVAHDPRGTLKMMQDLMELNNIPFDPVPPGPVTDLNGNIIDFDPKPDLPKPIHDWAEDGWPKHIGKVKKMCKERGIKFSRDAKREDLVIKLNQYTNQ